MDGLDQRRTRGGKKKEEVPTPMTVEAGELEADMRQIAMMLADLQKTMGDIQSSQQALNNRMGRIEDTIVQLHGLVSALNTSYQSLAKSVVQPTVPRIMPGVVRGGSRID